MSTVRVWKAPKNEHGAKYVAVDNNGNLISAYKKLSDIRKRYKIELELGFIEIKRELDRVYDPSKR